ncbi:MAG: diacylglycerol/lipid kinase family protein [bacterium]
MSVVILFNPVSGSGRALAAAERLAQGLRAAGVEVRLLPTERRAAHAWLTPALAGARALVVAGGDGAVRMSAVEAARASVPLWHAPCGTENLFARTFGMTSEPADVARALAVGRTAQVDLGRADDESFAIMASVGFDAEVVHFLAARRTGAISHLSYVRPILELARSWRANHLAWEIDGEREQLGHGMVVVGNMRAYGVRLNPAAEAVHDDGLLDAVFIPAHRAMDLLAWAPLLRLGLAHRLPDWVAAHGGGHRMRRGARIELTADPAARLQLDGDPSSCSHDPGSSNAVVRRCFWAEPGALRVLLPG